MWSFRSITNQRRMLYGIVATVVIAWGCSHEPIRKSYQGTIAYPFLERTPSLAPRNQGQDEKFVIRSAVGQTEYTVEIPGAARNYDIEVPIAEIRDGTRTNFNPSKSMPQSTDREITAQFPRVYGADKQDAALTDLAFGVASDGGPVQGPSYTLGVAKISTLYQERKLEYALIEINNLLSFYPSSPRLLKMKGTVLMKMRNYDLAEKAWQRAAELAPGDKRLKKALDNLQRKMTIQSQAHRPNQTATTAGIR